MKLPPAPESLCSALDRHAIEKADQLAVRFLHDGEVDGGATELTFAAFRRAALRVAAALQTLLRPGDRALLLYEGGLEFITAFYGCLYAGVIAVPSYPPDPRRLHRTLPRLQAIVEDAGATLVLCTADLRRAAQPLCAQADRLGNLQWLATDALDPAAALASPARGGPHDVAYLQYTSGSTGTPKGVIVTHDNLAWICGDLLSRFGYDGPCHQISWLPTFHDLGLIWGLLTPLSGGFPVTFMLPAAFLQRPARWLTAITHFRGTHTAAPNFAYELCVSKIPDALLPRLELSCLRAAMNAAEPVRPSTLAAFQHRFGPVGLRSTAQKPCYGLAEATLQATIYMPAAPPLLLPCSIRALEQQRIVPPLDRADTRVLVSCGQAAPFSQLAIVDPQTRRRLADDLVGEIWIAGPIVARGYWGRPEATAQTFASRIVDEDETRWLRTGDLGFLSAGQLFISGRAKDVLIVRGRNLYPQDLELEIEAVHPAIRPGCTAAFAIEVAGEERIGLVAEIEPERLAGLPAEDLLPLLRRAIAQGFDVQLHEVAVIPPRGIFKTSSGKIQRRRTATALAAGELTLLARWTAPRALPPPRASAARRLPADLESRITQWLKEVPEFVAPAAPLPDVPFQELGLDSASMVGMSGRLAELVGRPLPPTLLFDHPTLRALVAHLTRDAAAAPAESPPAETAEAAALPAEPIAIIGLGCRFPGGGVSPQAFWQALRNQVDGVSEVAGRRWPEAQTPGAPPPPELRWAGLLDAVDGFDAAFFGISPREAVSLDPQQRLLLEVAWEALEDAGLPREQLLGSPTGVFIGIANLDYQRLLAEGSEPADMYTLTGNLMSTAAGRLAYFFGLQGPCISVDTACSSALTAIHLSCQSLRRGESALAIAGGVNLILSPWGSQLMAAAQALSPDGRCKTFDASANGMVRAEGCGLIVLKRLSAAQRDGDRIWAIIRGSAVNQDGQSAGLTVPNCLAQQALLRAALADAGVAPAQVGYVETHGTGTALGDPIEVEALKAVLGQPRPGGSQCVLGAVKSNLGHLEAAAGVAGLIKAALALHHRAIPANLHLQTLNPRLPLADTPFVIPRQELAWASAGGPRIAAVSSFGISGTNAHVVLEEAPLLVATRAEPARVQLLPLSARSPEALQALIAAYRSWLTAPATSDENRLAEIAHMASARRSHHLHRVAVVGDSAAQWAQALQAAPAAAGAGAAPRAERPRLVFVFSGHGAQWLGMGRQLVQKEAVFRAALQECDAAIGHQSGWSLLHELQVDGGALSGDRLDVIQPALFAIQVALAALWRAWGVAPDAVVGHSLGEITAAHVAGALSLEQATRIVCRRSELLRRLKGQGAMALVELPFAAAEQALAGRTDRLAVAACNSPEATVLSGASAAMEEVLAQLEQRGVSCRRLKWAVAAGHSPQVDALLPELRAALFGLRPAATQTPIYSTVTASEIDPQALDREYWLRNLREPVQFAKTLRCMQDRGYELFLELSPHPILAPAIAETLHRDARHATVLPSLRRDQDERRSLLESLAALYELGLTPSWRHLHPAGGRCVSLPAYPWQRKRYWVSPDAAKLARPVPAADSSAAGHPLLGAALTSAVEPGRHFFQQQLSVAALPYLADHRVQGEVIFPAAGYLEMALAAAAAVYGGGAQVVEDLTLEQLLALPAGLTRAVQTVLTEQGPGRAALQIWSQEGARWVRHATATVRRAEGGAAAEATVAPLAQLQMRCTTQVSGSQHYQLQLQRGAAYGPAFQGTTELWLGTGEALGRVRLPAALQGSSAAYHFHPGFLDSCLQVMTGLLAAPRRERTAALLPTALARLRLHRPPPAAVWVHAQQRSAAAGDSQALTADLVVVDEAGKLVAELSGLQARPLEPDLSPAQESRWLYCRQWQLQQPAPVPPPPTLPAAWLLLADRGRTGAALAELLRARGHRCVLVLKAPPATQLQADSYAADPQDPEVFRRILAAEFAAQSCVGVVHLWSLDATAVAETTAQTLAADQDLGCISALHLAQALLAAQWQRLPPLHLVTRGAQAAGSQHPGLAVAQAPLWGLGRVINLEHPELRCRCIDLDPKAAETAAAETAAAALLTELLRDDREEQVALRAEGRYVARLVKTTLAAEEQPAVAPAPAQGRPFRLEIREPGVLERLKLYPLQRRPPGPGEVELAVAAAGLNFKDVLSALGMLLAEPHAAGRSQLLGGECAGTVTAVGEGVTGLRPGQQVLALCPNGGALASFVTTRHELVLPKPTELSFTQAATIPVVYLTACYGLAHVGRLEKGERVLIHAGSGGVGLAAIQYAQHIGAEIFATAGSAAKRDFLRSLGVPHVLDSRSLGFAAEIRRITSGEGVDVVLNSLSGEFIPQSLGLLRQFGRFVEIGVRDYLQDSRLGLKPFLNGLSFTLVDLVQLAQQRPALVRRLLQEVLQLFAAGIFRPTPGQTFPISQAAAAFAQMAGAKHLGKIALTLPDHEAQIVPEPAAPAAIRGDACYLITGGLGGLGLGLGRWLVERGARHLVLVGRSPPSAAARPHIAALEQAGAQVVVAPVDIAQRDEVAALLLRLDSLMPPLRGIIHAAAVLADGTLPELSAERFRAPLAPKVLGAWNLHALTLEQPLDFFVMYSSAAMLLGSPGQANYAAANAFLDALAQHRRQLGRCGMSIHWGPFSAAGGAAAHAARGERLAARGLASLTPEQGQELLGRLLPRSRAPLGVMDFALEKWLASYPSEAQSPFLSALRQQHPAAADSRAGSGLALQLQGAPPIERQALLEAHLAEQLGRVLRQAATDIDRQAPFVSLGLDSLMSLELRNRLTGSLGHKLAATTLASHPSIAKLAAHLAAQLGLGSQPAADSVAALRADAGLDLSVCPLLSWSGPQRPPSRILLTGATGFLGAFLLQQLLEQGSCEIACLIRAPDLAAGHARLCHALVRHELWRPEYGPRIIPILGDLAQPLLGLGAAGFSTLARSVDEIYHSGASVDWHEAYSGLRAVNVLGTQEVLRLSALHHVKPLHYVSSLATLAPLMATGGVLRESDEADWQELDFNLLNTGYIQSKWVAEKKVLVARSRGLPVAIYRPGFITGDSRKGTWLAPQFFYDLIKGCIQLGRAPAWNAAIGIIAVDEEAQAIVHIARQSGCYGKNFHVLGQLGMPGAEELSYPGLWAYIRRRGYPLEVVPHAAFYDSLLQAADSQQGRENALRSYLPHLQAPLFSSARRLEYDCTNARAFLPQAGGQPGATERLLDLYFDQMETAKFLPLPQAKK